MGIWNKSSRFINQAQKVFSTVNDYDGMAKCFNLLAIYNIENGFIKKGINYFKKCLDTLDKKLDIKQIAQIEMNLGVSYHILNNFEKSLFYFHKSLLKFENSNDYENLAILKFDIGALYYEFEKVDLSMKELDEALFLATKNNMLPTIIRIYNVKSRVALKIRDIKLSLAYWKIANDIFKKIKDPYLNYLMCQTRGIIACYQKKYAMSERYLLKSIQQVAKLNYSVYVADSEFELGKLYTKWKKKNEALVSFRLSLDIYKNSGITQMAEKVKKQISLLLD